MTQSKGTRLKANRLESITKKYVPDNELRDTPARLFRKLLNFMEMTPKKWSEKIRSHLDWVITTQDREKAKNERIHQTGNLRDAFFHKPTLTFNKLVEGLSVIGANECEVILRIKTEEGEYEVSERFVIHHANNHKPK